MRVAAADLEVRATAPVAAVDALRREGLHQQRGFHLFDWGGYLVFREVPSYVDGRLEPFLSSGVFERYLAIEQQGDLAALDAQGVRWVLTRPGLPISKALGVGDDWERLFSDQASELWRRRPAPTSRLEKTPR